MRWSSSDHFGADFTGYILLVAVYSKSNNLKYVIFLRKLAVSGAVNGKRNKELPQFFHNGMIDGNRTHDIQIHSLALYPVSYYQHKQSECKKHSPAIEWAPNRLASFGPHSCFVMVTNCHRLPLEVRALYLNTRKVNILVDKNILLSQWSYSIILVALMVFVAF